jgi:glutamate synthase domain-containing protein 1
MARRRHCEKALEAAMTRSSTCRASRPATIVFKGMVMPQYLTQFYPDLDDPRLESSVAVFHQRFSTNTLPQWRLAHPYRYLAHNGEINTIQGNRNWAVRADRCSDSPLLPELRRHAAAGVAHGLGLAEPRQHARGAVDGRPRSAARHAPADAAGVAIGWT